MAKRTVTVSDLSGSDVIKLAVVRISLESDPTHVRSLELDESEIPAKWMNNAILTEKRGRKNGK